jgi:hypothetical protein
VVSSKILGAVSVVKNGQQVIGKAANGLC